MALLTKALKYITISILVMVVYVVTAVPVGLFLYTWKTEKGINIFTYTGFHSYLGCIAHEAQKIRINQAKEQDRAQDSVQDK